MAQDNSKQNIITAVSIIIALIAVVYALMGHVEKPGTVDVSAPIISDKAYSEGENNPVVMQINGKDVTRAEIMDNFTQSGSQLPQGTNLVQIFPLLQEQYLVGHLLTNAAKDAGIDQNTPYVQKQLKSTLDQAIRAAYIEKMGDDEISEDDVKKAYDDIVGNANPIMERKAHHILVETESAANALILKLENGADFVTLAKENSTGPSADNGGDLGYFAKEEMVPEFATAAFALNVGEYTKEPVQTQFGYHVIRVDDERARPKPTFDEVKDQLAEQLKQAVVREKMTKLRDDAKIILFDMNGNPINAEATDAPVEETSEDDNQQTEVVPAVDESGVEEAPADQTDVAE